ncbi:GerMN domain-containing protein [Pseudogracilibacillus sp. SO30301A]|uniref:GerMN domain-containing protein n=1 Tax=Pseudogracilibacillus sp. SO30301A TaxID=3098291 RepID=UPI00300E0D56
MQKIKFLHVQLLIVLVLLLGGCLKGEQTFEEVDVPEDVTIVDEEGKETEGDDPVEEEEEVIESDETVARELYLIDASGMVVPQTLELPKTESAATQALEYLVKDGPVTEMLPNGFQAVLPAGTEIIGLNLEEDGTLIVDLSEEFKNYEAEEEVKILQAMTHTLTQFDSVNKIKLWINGENLDEMPVNGTPLSEGYSKSNGINIYVKDQPSLMHSKVVTVHYPKQYNDNLYFVPMTQYINDDNEDVFTTIVEALMEGPSYEIQGLQVFNDNTTLLTKPVLNDGVLQLEFSEEILKDEEKAVIADDVVETLVRSLTEQEDVEAVDIKVENKEKVVSENGTTYDKPVTKNDIIKSEKM